MTKKLVLPEDDPPRFCTRCGLGLEAGEFHPLRPELFDALTGMEIGAEVLPDLHCPENSAAHDRWRLLAGGMWYKFL